MKKTNKHYISKRKFNKSSWIIALLVVSSLLLAGDIQVSLDNQDSPVVDELTPTTPLQPTAAWTAPWEIGQCWDTTGGNAQDVQVVGSLAYVADRGDGLEIINITDPAHPFEIGEIDDGGLVIGLHVVGNLAYVTDYNDGLEIINVTDPTNASGTFREIGQFDDGGAGYDVQVVGHLAYVADYTDGLEIINVTDPTNPDQIGQFDDGGRAQGVQVVGHLAYIADYDNGLEIIDISDPTNSTGTFRKIGQYYDYSGWATDLHVVGGFAYVADSSDGLEIINVTDPTHPEKVATVPSKSSHTRDVRVLGTLAFIADDNAGLRIINISDPSKPVEIGQFDDAGAAMSVRVVGTRAYVADYSQGLEIIEGALSPDTAWETPAEVAHYVHGFANPHRMEVVGNIAYIADYQDGLEVVDVTDPANPTHICDYDPGISAAWDVQVVGSLLYVCDYNLGLQIHNITDPTNPSHVNTFDWGGSPRSIDVVGQLAYIADYTYGLAIINVSDPNNMYNISHLDDGGVAYDIHVVGPLAYVADREDGLEIIDISDPTSPTKIGQYYDSSGRAYGVEVVGPLAYVADDADGLEIINITDPVHPTEIGAYFDNYNQTRELQVVGNLVFLADGSDDLEIINVTDPTNPTEVGQYNATPGYSNGLFVVGDLVYLADYGGGMRIIEGHAPVASSPPNATHAHGATGRYINWTLSDNIASGYYRVLLNDNPYGSWQPWSADTNLSVLVDTSTLGLWNYTIQYNDSVGIWGQPDTVFITVNDQTAPWHSDPANATRSLGATASLYWTLYDNAGGGYYRVLRNETPLDVWKTWLVDAPFPISINTTTVGVWNYTIAYNDTTGLWGEPDSVFITIEDPIAPWASHPTNATYQYGAVASINWSLYDNYDEGLAHVYRNGNPIAIWFPWSNNTPFYVNVDTTELGLWNYTLIYNDSVGLWGQPDTVFITIQDPTAPWSSTPSGATYTQGASANINWSLYDNVAGGYYNIIHNGTSLNGWIPWSNGTPLIIPVDTSIVGVWNYTIQYNDSAGLWGIPHTVIITVEQESKGGIPGFEFLFGFIGLAALVWKYHRKKAVSELA